jgi:hypothetical protein
MLKIQVLDEPLKLQLGMTGLFKVKGHLWCITILSDQNNEVEFSFPLKADGVMHKVAKSDIWMPLNELANFSQLALPKNAHANINQRDKQAVGNRGF